MRMMPMMKIVSVIDMGTGVRELKIFGIGLVVSPKDRFEVKKL